MTQEDRKLLLTDLCARLPYGVCVHIRYKEGEPCYGKLTPRDIQWFIDSNIENIKPYLRPMSSMTEEEKQMMNNLWKDNNKLVFADPDEVRRYRFYDISVVDFLNSRHFDYRGLIEKGLALEAPEDMYK